MNNGVQFLMKKNKVDIIWGEAALTEPGEIKVEPTKKPPMQPQVAAARRMRSATGTYKAKNIIIATGARPRVLPGIEPDGERIWTYFEAMKPKEMPKSLVVMGSGAIGMEFASFYRAMGARGDDHRAAAADPAGRGRRDRRARKKRFEKRGIKFMTDAKVAKVDKTKTGDRRPRRAQGRQQDRGLRATG